MLGPPAYDVVSLGQDARVDVAPELELRLIGAYARARKAYDPAFDLAAFAEAYAIMGAQRNTKILGIFARLDKRDGKPAYLRHLPRIEAYLARNLAHPALAEVAAWHARHLPRRDAAVGRTPPEALAHCPSAARALSCAGASRFGSPPSCRTPSSPRTPWCSPQASASACARSRTRSRSRSSRSGARRCWTMRSTGSPPRA